MANIKINNLLSSDFESSQKSVSFLKEVTEKDCLVVKGGNCWFASSFSKFEPFLNYIVAAYVNLVAMEYIYRIASKFNVK